MELTHEHIEVPNAAEIDMFLPMHTGSLKSDAGDIKSTKTFKIRKSEEGEEIKFPVIQGFGSSTIVDTDGDTFTVEAQKSLCTAPDGLGVWKNHSFQLFEDYMGELDGKPDLITPKSADWPTGAIPPDADNWAGVWIRAALETENPPAALLHKFVNKGHRFGFSVGCMYTKYAQKRDGRGVVKGFTVHEVRPVEWSVVGVPANQASWVDTTKKMLVNKGLMPSDGNIFAPTGEVLYRFKNFESLPEKDAVVLRRVMEGLESRFGMSIGVPFEDGSVKRQVF